MGFDLLLPAFVAGLLTFLLPCTLPLVPAYLGFISGTSLPTFREAPPILRRKILLNGVGFVLGFSLVFVAFGLLAGFVGAALLSYRIWLMRLAGGLIIFFGLLMLNAIKIPFLQIQHRLRMPSIFPRGHWANAWLLGLAFGLGWTPCLGPVLGSILLLASTSATAFQGGLLLAVFAMGLALPFLVIAASLSSTATTIAKITRYLEPLWFLAGIFLISLGLLILTNNMGFFTTYSYRLFNFLNYERLLDYL